MNENNLELGEEFMLADENGRVIYKDKTFFLKNTSTSTSDLLVCKDEENFCPTILLGLLNWLILRNTETVAARNRRRIFLRRG